jgi:alanyl-tRNA synthetase
MDDNPRYTEIWNNVFMQFYKDKVEVRRGAEEVRREIDKKTYDII